MATLLFLVYSVTAGLQFVSPLGFAVPLTSEGGNCSSVLLVHRYSPFGSGGYSSAVTSSHHLNLGLPFEDYPEIEIDAKCRLSAVKGAEFVIWTADSLGLRSKRCATG